MSIYYRDMEEWSDHISAVANALDINNDPKIAVIWDVVFSECLYRSDHGEYMIGRRSYGEAISKGAAADWLRKNKYRLPNELKEVSDE